MMIKIFEKPLVILSISFLLFLNSYIDRERSILHYCVLFTGFVLLYVGIAKILRKR